MNLHVAHGGKDDDIGQKDSKKKRQQMTSQKKNRKQRQTLNQFSLGFPFHSSFSSKQTTHHTHTHSNKIMHTRSKKFKSSQTPFEILDPALFMAILSFLNEKEWVKDYSCLYQVSHACMENILQTKLMMNEIDHKMIDHHNMVSGIFFLNNCAAPRLLSLTLFNVRGVLGREMQLAAGGSPLLKEIHLASVSIGREGGLAFAQAVAAGHFAHLEILAFMDVCFDAEAKEQHRTSRKPWATQAHFSPCSHLDKIAQVGQRIKRSDHKAA